MEALIGPGITALVALLGGLVGLWWRGKQERESRVESEARDYRTKLYERIVLMAKTGQLQISTSDHSTQIALYASDDVVKAWTAFIDCAIDKEGQQSSTEALDLWARLLLAMRRDAGRPGSRLSESDIRAALGVRKGRDIGQLMEKYPSRKSDAAPDAEG